MIKKWLIGLNLALCSLAALFLLAAFFLYFTGQEITPVKTKKTKKTLPKNAFQLEQKEYDRIGSPFLSLRFSPMTLQLPDLRNYLIYYGRNERPDAQADASLMHFGFAGSKENVSTTPESPLYLVYAKNQPQVKYLFSEDNRETSLWISATPKKGEASILVAMKNEKEEVIRKPQEFAKFSLKEKPFSRLASKRWELGKWRVDGTLLARQRARWYGNDLFLEKHGGKEYGQFQGKQRIEFGEGDEKYSVYIGKDDALIWKDNRFVEAVPSPDTQQFPLLVINKMDDRLMRLDFWDVGGKAKMTLNLIKSADTSLPQNIEKHFKFVGARTRSQLTFEVDQQRMLISPLDWLLYIDGKWVKLDSNEDIDAYVERKLLGPLLVIDDILLEDGKQTLMGTLFNSTRTDAKAIEIALQQGVSSQLNMEKQANSKDDKSKDLEETDES